MGGKQVLTLFLSPLNLECPCISDCVPLSEAHQGLLGLTALTLRKVTENLISQPPLPWNWDPWEHGAVARAGGSSVTSLSKSANFYFIQRTCLGTGSSQLLIKHTQSGSSLLSLLISLPTTGKMTWKLVAREESHTGLFVLSLKKEVGRYFNLKGRKSNVCLL